MKTTTFRDLVEINPKVDLKKGESYPFVEMALVEPSNRYVRTEKERTFKGGGSRFLDDDTIFARITPCLENGKIGQYKGLKSKAAFGSTEFFVFRSRNNISDSGYVYYLCRSDLVKSPAIKSMSGASGRQRASIDSILDVQVPAHSFSTQRKIAAILSAYDDLIENNLRRIKILEEMAQNLYREWFVKFRFPGYEKVKFVESPLGMIPEGWGIHNIFDEAEVTYGYAFKSKRFTTKKIGKPVVRIRDILAGKSDTFSDEEVTERYNIKNGDLLVGMDGDFHMGFWIGGPANLVQRVARFRPNGRVSRYLLFFLLKEPIETFNATISGTTVAHLGHKHISTIQFLIPPDHILRIIDQNLEQFLKEIINLRISNETLRQTRDLLLPKLISGDFDVSNLDIEVSEEVTE